MQRKGILATLTNKSFHKTERSRLQLLGIPSLVSEFTDGEPASRRLETVVGNSLVFN